MIFKLKQSIFIFLILTLAGCSEIHTPTAASISNTPTHIMVTPVNQIKTPTVIVEASPTKPIATSTLAQNSTVMPSTTPTPEPEVDSIPICAGEGQISSPPTSFGITGAIVYQVDKNNGLYTIGGTPLKLGKIVDQQEQVTVYGFSPDGNWLAYAPMLDFAQDKIIFSTPVMIMLSAERERIEQKINIDGLEEEMQNLCVGCQGYHFWGSLGKWINNDLMQLYLGATNNFGPSAYLPKVFDPWSGDWQNQWFEDLPDLYNIGVRQGVTHKIQLSPDLSRVLYPSVHGGLILWDITQGIAIWSDSQFQNHNGEYIEWSPDSRMVAVVNRDYGEGKHRLLMITRDGKATELVNANKPQPEFYAGSLSWSPDSRYLAFAASTGSLDQVREVYMYLYDNQTRSYLYRCPLPGINDITYAGLIWSPDGQWIEYQEQPFSAMRLLNVQSGEIIEVLKNAKPVGWSDKFPVEWP